MTISCNGMRIINLTEGNVPFQTSGRKVVKESMKIFLADFFPFPRAYLVRVPNTPHQANNIKKEAPPRLTLHLHTSHIFTIITNPQWMAHYAFLNKFLMLINQTDCKYGDKGSCKAIGVFTNTKLAILVLKIFWMKTKIQKKVILRGIWSNNLWVIDKTFHIELFWHVI